MSLIIPILLALSIGLFYKSYSTNNNWFIFSIFIEVTTLFFIYLNFTTRNIPFGNWLSCLILISEISFCCFTKGEYSLRFAAFVLSTLSLVASLV